MRRGGSRHPAPAGFEPGAAGVLRAGGRGWGVLDPLISYPVARSAPANGHQVAVAAPSGDRLAADSEAIGCLHGREHGRTAILGNHLVPQGSTEGLEGGLLVEDPLWQRAVRVTGLGMSLQPQT